MTRLVIAGDIDDSSFADLIAVLSNMPDGPGEIHIDVVGLQYCDVAGLRAIKLAERTGRQDHSHRRVVLHDLPA